MEQLEVNVRAAGKSLLDGWQTATTLLQEQMDGMDPTCACTRACDRDRSQIVMPAVVGEDEVPYPYAHENPRPMSKAINPMPNSTISTVAAPVEWRCEAREDEPTPTQKCATKEPEKAEGSTSLPPPRPEKADVSTSLPPPSSHHHNFNYYAEYHHIHRPPTTIASTALVNTSVRPAPWAQWENAGKPRAAAQSPTQARAGGANLAANGVSIEEADVGAGQPSRELDVEAAAEKAAAEKAVAEKAAAERVAAARVAAEMQMAAEEQAAAERAAAEKAAAERAVAERAAAEKAAAEQAAAEQAAAERAAAEAVKIREQQAQQAASETTEDPADTVSALAPPAKKDRPRNEAKSVLSQSTALKSSVAATLGQAAEIAPKRSAARTSQAASVLSQSAALKSSVASVLGEAAEGAPKRASSKPRQNQDAPSDRKSALSVNTAMTSSAAAALGALSAKPSGGRRSGSAERSSAESVVGASAPPSSTPLAAVQEDAPAPKAANAAGQSKQRSKSRGPDAKSVISGLNSSSSASALLAPMMNAQQPKRRRPKADGGDVASIV